MQLYFSPLACSMASRIAFYEAGYAATYLEVDPKTKRLLTDGSDFRAINPLGYVPVLRTDASEILTENAAILQHIAEHLPDAALAGSARERDSLRQWLCFIGTELHKALFTPLLTKGTPDAAKAWVLEKYRSRLDHLNSHLKGREFLLGGFSVADAYLVTVLNWTMATPQIDLNDWPAIKAYHARLRERPSIARAIAEEFELFKAEQARHKAAA